MKKLKKSCINQELERSRNAANYAAYRAADRAANKAATSATYYSAIAAYTGRYR